MATHTPDYLMTAEEAKNHYRYMKPHGVYCAGERIAEKDYGRYILDYAEVCSGIVEYHTHEATPAELASAARAKTDYENREHCKRIAEGLEAYTNGSAYRCPECGEVHNFEDYEMTEHENADGGTCYQCPNCNAELCESDLEAVDVYDYFSDCLDIEFRCGSDKEFRSVRIMVTCGGPNIYIDTATKQVELYWWGDRASYPISYDAAAAVDEWAEEYWGCLQ